MKIYKLTQNDSTGYDTYKGMIVIAENESDARNIHPNSNRSNDSNYWWKNSTWG